MICIICATNKEIEESKLILKEYKTEKILNIEVYIGKIQGKDVIVTQCGIGKVNAGATTFAVIAKYKPSLIINTGVCGAIDEKLVQNDIIISTKTTFYDVDLTTDNYEYGQMAGLPRFFESNINVKDLLFDEKYINGILLTADIFACNKAPIDEITNKYFSDYYCPGVDMESAAIAQIAHMNGVEFIIIRTVSDVVGQNNQFEYHAFASKAAKEAARITSKIVNRI